MVSFCLFNRLLGTRRIRKKFDHFLCYLSILTCCILPAYANAGPDAPASKNPYPRNFCDAYYLMLYAQANDALIHEFDSEAARPRVLRDAYHMVHRNNRLAEKGEGSFMDIQDVYRIANDALIFQAKREDYRSWTPDFKSARRIFEFREAERLIKEHGGFEEFFERAYERIKSHERFGLQKEKVYARLAYSIMDILLKNRSTVRKLKHPFELADMDPFGLLFQEALVDAAWQHAMDLNPRRTFREWNQGTFLAYRTFAQRVLEPGFKEIERQWGGEIPFHEAQTDFVEHERTSPTSIERVWSFPGKGQVISSATGMKVKMMATRVQTSRIADHIEAAQTNNIFHKWLKDGQVKGPNEYQILEHMRSPKGNLRQISPGIYEVELSFVNYDRAAKDVLKVFFNEDIPADTN